MPKGLFILFLLCINQCLQAQLTYQQLQVDYDSAWTWQHLKIIPIRYKGTGGGQPAKQQPNEKVIPISKALRDGTVVVGERGSASTENVHWLRINNHSGQPVYFGSGEVIMGGRQDRMVTMDTILAPSSKDQYVGVMCVEEGRWSEKEKKFAYQQYANPRLRKVLDQSRNQVVVWKEIYDQLEHSQIRSASLAYLAQRTDKKVMVQREDYFNYFYPKLHATDSSNIAGFVCMSGDKVIGCDVFADVHLFNTSLEGLLQGYIEEAVLNGKPVNIADEQVKKYLDKVLTDERSQQEYLKKNGKIYHYEGQVFRITGYAGTVER